MDQQLQHWRSRDGEKLWLSMLIDTMEEVARPEIRAIPCDPAILAALGAQLARPASPQAFGISQSACETTF
ncbi:MAG: transcriptional regulator [Bradyrhizobium sp.]